MPKIVCVKISKGGVGKTTIVTNLSHFMAKTGHKILLIDLDSQANLSKTFIKEFDNDKLTSSNLLAEEFGKIEDYTYFIEENLDLISADIGLFEVGKYLESKEINESIKTLKKILEHKDFEKYDYVFLDLSPGVADIITHTSLLAADLVICPIHFDIDSLSGLILTIDEISHLNSQGIMTKEVDYLIVPNRYDLRFKADNETIINMVYENLEKEFIAEPIRENSHIKKARMLGKSAIEYELEPERKYEHKKANEDFSKLAKKVEKILNKNE